VNTWTAQRANGGTLNSGVFSEDGETFVDHASSGDVQAVLRPAAAKTQWPRPGVKGMYFEQQLTSWRREQLRL
jgi:hypothetical protein